jgi:hypothetical protein
LTPETVWGIATDRSQAQARHFRGSRGSPAVGPAHNLQAGLGVDPSSCERDLQANAGRRLDPRTQDVLARKQRSAQAIPSSARGQTVSALRRAWLLISVFLNYRSIGSEYAPVFRRSDLQQYAAWTLLSDRIWPGLQRTDLQDIVECMDSMKRATPNGQCGLERSILYEKINKESPERLI